MPGKINKSSPSYIRTKGGARKALGEVAKNLESVIQTIKVNNKEALDEIAKEIEATSNKYAPMDTEELRKSSYIASEESGDNYTVEIGYTSDYANFQHENYGTSYINPTTKGTRPKFLQLAGTEIESDIKDIVARKQKETFK